MFEIVLVTSLNKKFLKFLTTMQNIYKIFNFFLVKFSTVFFLIFNSYFVLKFLTFF